MSPKNSGGSTKFQGGHKVIRRTAQTAFVRVVTPRFQRGIVEGLLWGWGGGMGILVGKLKLNP